MENTGNFVSKEIGDRAEQIAVDYLLCEKQYQIVARNYNTRFGEIDIVALDGNVLVFVEVKYRKNNSYGGAYEYVSKSKIAKIKRAAWVFIKANRQLPDNFRIDVIAIDGAELKHYKNITL